MKGFKANTSVVSLDIGSNDITYEGAIYLFEALKNNNTLTYLNISNHDRLHRNRIGYKACKSLKELLQKNKVLSILNI